jgi:hypothetical protein
VVKVDQNAILPQELLQFFAAHQVASALKQRDQNCAGLIR